MNTRKKITNNEKRYKKALEAICSAFQLKHEVRDYKNIGINAMNTAKEALNPPCSKCGK